MQDSKDVIIPLSKSKLVASLLGSILFVMGGLWLLFWPPIINLPLFGNPSVIFVSGLASTLFFGILAILYFFKLPDQKPGLIIGVQGITDNSSAVAAGLIKWGDIISISVIEIHKQKLIMLYVNNPEMYISRQKNIFKRGAMRVNLKMYETPLSITDNGLKCNFEELLNLIEVSFNNVKDAEAKSANYLE